MFKQQKQSDDCVQHQQRARLSPGTTGCQTYSSASHGRIPSCFPASCPRESIVCKCCQSPFISHTGGSPWSRASARQPQLLIPGTASLTPQRQLKQHSCHSQNKVPSCRRKDGSKILAHHQQIIPFILSRQLPRKNGHFQLTQQNLEATGCIYIPWNNTQSCYSVTPGPCFVPSRSECKPETCFVYRRHLQNQNRQRQKKKHLLN